MDSRIVSEASKHSICLRFIDLYGNFLANQLQLPVLVSELKEMAFTMSDQALKDNINRLVVFLNDSVGVHTYVRFIGD
ncbi:hypothetical protein ACMYR3_05350 [Ampullimonas aquatilis]|uniref:hypothetical protein n=1 Tax=Ampullimonas aquatilis TaxID=1341549 RepID=UPI003C74A368